MQSKSTKKSLIASGLSLLTCAALLIGTTFAWFTDSVTNKDNRIEAGTLAINAYAYDLAENGDSGFTITGVNNGEKFYFETTGQDLKTNTTPIINETLWEPSQSSAKLLQVTNGGTLAAKIKLDFTTEGELTDALWFDFVQVKDGTVSGEFIKRPMNTLDTFADNLEMPLLNNGDTLQFILVYGMYEDAGNTYQGDSFEADVTILATQTPKEQDGFGNKDYDEEATLDFTPVSTEQEFQQALASGEPISLEQDIDLTNAVSLTGDLIIQGNGKTIDASKISAGSNVFLINHADNGATVKMSGVNYVTTNYNNAGIAIANSTDVTVELDNCNFSGFKYALWVANNNSNVQDITIKNTNLSGWAAAYFYIDNNNITFENCVLEGTNKHSGTSNAFGTVVVQGPGNGNATGNNNTLTFKNCVLKASQSGDQPQHLISFSYGAKNNTAYFNDCTFEKAGNGYIFSQGDTESGNRVFVDGKEINENTLDIEFKS